MDTTTLKIALAGLMHDIGKLAQDGLEISPEYKKNNTELYQPYNKQNNYHSHRHALYTAAFIEQMADVLPQELNAVVWGEDKSFFINLAARHHKPENALESLITQADWISSGLDRASFQEGDEIKIREYRNTRLLPLFEQLDLGTNDARQNIEEFEWEYPLKPLNSSSIFPRRRSSRTKEEAKEEYKKLYDQFVAALRQLKNRDNVALWMEHFDSLLQNFTSMIPQARVKMVVPDVSLYDHARTTSALAAALYLYHREHDSLEEKAIFNGSEEKFLLIGGDFYGIQDFIFSSSGDTSANRSKLLRGRSFYVSLFSELAADMLCRSLGLPATAVVLNAAGKFTLLAANTKKAREKINEVCGSINQWLYANSYGISSFGITVTAARQDEFSTKHFGSLWNRHKQEMEETKSCRIDLQKFGGAVPMEQYLERFNNNLSDRLCPFCAIRPATVHCQVDDRNSCSLCMDQITIGTQLVKNKWLAIMDDPRDGVLQAPLLGRYQLRFCSEGEAEKLSSSHLVKLWNTSLDSDGRALSPVTSRFLNGYVPTCSEIDLQDGRLTAFSRKEEDLRQLEDGARDGRPKTFSDIACLARHIEADLSIHGTPALGILKADVDRLGLLMGCGLPEERYTISRMATLSRQLDSFFSLYLPYLLKSDVRFQAVYTVFAGGDDLFLIGPWNRMRELALYLRDKFSLFVCKNPEIHFSAGISMCKPHAPVDRVANIAEEALERAKDTGRNRVTVFNETISWDALEKLVDCQTEMELWRQEYVSGSLFYRFNEFIDMAEKEKGLQGRDITCSDMQCLRWHAMFQYQLVRNLNKKLQGTARQEALKEMQQFVRWLEEMGGAMRIPLWTILYNLR
ncbi:type III-A CRISPR-associated protein Cas10/Csm1 [Desulforhopalus vacuolatus]|uniref:type III-A CRISPR-associated protein Cas10/Csm1 n=1 Tax=Desulforhopalus vacuolatus TaxID=40414 RepID=UPI001962B411|nr:type III-A CRISPR-associated protein Cas10/Csm1 [Desulforhopalus vacuolatus]MBM9520570.1 type III-A CRISPR-associated protein Cas10/Csm1 [Desulforhopalus vacuolatus]